MTSKGSSDMKENRSNAVWSRIIFYSAEILSYFFVFGSFICGLYLYATYGLLAGIAVFIGLFWVGMILVKIARNL